MSASPQDVIRAEILALSAYHVPCSQGMVKLDAMENPYRLPEALRREIAAALADAELNRYPDPTAPRLKARLREAAGIPDRYEILLGNGSDELIHVVAQCVAKPGAAMIAPSPSFVMYGVSALIAGLRYVAVPLREDFSFDETRFLEAIARHRPAVVFIASPNNPSGNLFPEEAIARIADAAPGLVVVDEAYHVFAGRTFLSRLDEFANVLLLRTVSKLGLAGLRLGYLIARPEWSRELDKVRGPYNIGVLTQAAGEIALAHYDVFLEQARRICAERERLAARLAALAGVTVFPSRANFILVRVADAPRAFEGLLRRGVLVKNLHGADPSLDHCLRITVGTREENERLLEALAEALAGC